MKRIMEQSKYIVLVAVLSTLVAAVTAYLWGGYKTFKIIAGLIGTAGSNPFAAVSLVELMDTFLVATALLIFSVGLYELFIQEVSLPPWLVIHDLHDLKAKLSSVIILLIAVTFLAHFVEWQDPQGTLYFGISAAIVTASLIAFGHVGHKD
jgi:uncharacterized membrane protein YqhA